MQEEKPVDPSTLSDRDLIAHYEMTDGESDNPRAAALLKEIERRGLDI